MTCGSDHPAGCSSTSASVARQDSPRGPLHLGCPALFAVLPSAAALPGSESARAEKLLWQPEIPDPEIAAPTRSVRVTAAPPDLALPRGSDPEQTFAARRLLSASLQSISIVAGWARWESFPALLRKWCRRTKNP